MAPLSPPIRVKGAVRSVNPDCRPGVLAGRILWLALVSEANALTVHFPAQVLDFLGTLVYLTLGLSVHHHAWHIVKNLRELTLSHDVQLRAEVGQHLPGVVCARLRVGVCKRDRTVCLNTASWAGCRASSLRTQYSFLAGLGRKWEIQLKAGCPGDREVKPGE